jgi:hypothetical protein
MAFGKQSLCGRSDRETRLNEGIVGKLDDKDADHAQENLPDEAAAMAQCEMRAEKGTEHVADRHQNGQQGQEVAMRDKKASAARLVATLTTFEAAEACRKSKPKKRTKRKIRKLPVPGPKKPS